MSNKVRTIRLDQIAVDAGTQIRAAITENIVAEYAERMSEGVQFPPVVLFHDGNQYYMADGFHRGMAVKRNGLVEIEAEVHAGTKVDALWFALGANKSHGHRLSNADKSRAILLAIQTWPDRSSRQLCEQIGCHDSAIRRVRAQVVTTHHLPDHVTGRDGKRYPASRPPGSKAHPKTDRILQRLKSGTAVHAIADELKVGAATVTKVRKAAGLIYTDTSRAATKDRLQKMREMAESGHTSRQIAAAVGVSEAGCRGTMRKAGIVVPADRAVGNTQRHNSNRIVDRMVADAENLTADVNLIEFSTLNPEHLEAWLTSLAASKKALETFIRRLQKEQQRVQVA